MRNALVAPLALSVLLTLPTPIQAQVAPGSVITRPGPVVIRPGSVVTQPLPQVPRSLPRQGLPNLPPPPPPPSAVADRPGEDKDGDGVRYPQDCDDNDASRYPGASEFANDRDEDCNEETVGWLDSDMDGYTSALASNPRFGGVLNTGPDCDDSQAGIRPDAQELPNRLDDNCDGVIDNLIGTWWTPGRQ